MISHKYSQTQVGLLLNPKYDLFREIYKGSHIPCNQRQKTHLLPNEKEREVGLSNASTDQAPFPHVQVTEEGNDLFPQPPQPFYQSR